MIKITITVTNNNPNTVWNRLAAKLGREPTRTEAIAEVKRIFTENMVEMAGEGQLSFQERR